MFLFFLWQRNLKKIPRNSKNDDKPTTIEGSAEQEPVPRGEPVAGVEGEAPEIEGQDVYIDIPMRLNLAQPPPPAHGSIEDAYQQW